MARYDVRSRLDVMSDANNRDLSNMTMNTNDSESRSMSVFTKALCTIGFLCLLGAGITALIYFPFITKRTTPNSTAQPSANNDWRPQPPFPYNPPSSPSTMTKSPNQVRWILMKEQIENSLTGLTTNIFGTDKSSYQYQALDWIVYLDPRRLSVLDVTLSQRFVLATIWFSMGGTSWVKNTNWLSGKYECEWHGIFCSPFQGDVMYVTRLNLEQNELKGGIPKEISGLAYLEGLLLGKNSIQGSLPNTMGSLQSMKQLRLYSNSLTGSIPTTIGSIKNLELLYLDSNLLEGTIPSELGNLVNLKDINLHDNSFHGLIPDKFSSLDLLRRFWVSGNFFTGTFPNAILDMTNLNDLYLDNNQFHGNIPDGIALALPKLRDFRLDHNLFSGCLPDELFQMNKLEILYMDNNQISCRLSSNIYNSPVLEDLELFNNMISGTLPIVPDTSSLRVLHIGNNKLTGSIPVSFARLENLAKLVLSNNELTNTIPSELSRLTDLMKLELNHNKLKKRIPYWVGFLPKLTYLHLHENRFTGTIPHQLQHLSNVVEMTFDSNSLDGSVPKQLCKLFSKSLELLTADCAGSMSSITCDCCTLCY